MAQLQQHLSRQSLLFSEPDLDVNNNTDSQGMQSKQAGSEHHVIFVGEPHLGSSMHLIVAPARIEVTPHRSMRFWCVRFLLLVFLVSLFQLAIVLLFPPIHQLLTGLIPESPESPASSTSEHQNRQTELNDVFFAVKSTKRFHQTRLSVLLDTWIDQAKHQTFIFTDAEDDQIRSRLPDDAEHFVVTDCAPEHSRSALACKMARELAGYYATADGSKRWFCHFDDDTYVNVPLLVDMLNEFDAAGEWYVGRTSLAKPMPLPSKPSVKFNFATGGAGFCLSQALMAKLRPLVVDGKFEQMSEKIRLPDDCTLGYAVEVVLGRKLTIVERLHSHLEFLAQAVTDESLSSQVTYSYSKMIDRHADAGAATLIDQVFDNVVGLSKSGSRFTAQQDPTRLLTSHCTLFPSLRICQ